MKSLMKKRTISKEKEETGDFVIISDISEMLPKYVPNTKRWSPTEPVV